MRPVNPEERSDKETAALTETPPGREPTRQDAPQADGAKGLSILDAIGVGVYGLDLKGLVTFVNPAAVQMVGYTYSELQGVLQHERIHHSHADGSPYPVELCPIYLTLRDGEVHYRDDEVFWRKDGTSFAVSYTSTPILQDGKPAGAVIVFRDVSSLRKAEAWEKAKGRILSAIIDQRSLPDALSDLADSFTRFRGGHAVAIHIMQGARLLLAAEAGLDPESRDLMRVLESPLTRPAATTASGQPRLEAEVSRALPLPETILCLNADGGTTPAAERLTLPLLTPAGEVVGMLTGFSSVPDAAGELRGALSEVADLARLLVQHAAMQQRLAHLAQHDALTGLPNRVLLDDRIEQAIRSSRRLGTSLGVCYLDLDRFKQVNDTWGHAAGDEYLIKVSAALRKGCREMDTLARLGGDEFIVLLPDLSAPEEAMLTAERLLTMVRTPITIAGTSVHPTASLGVSVYPQHGDTAAALLANADAALYTAKRKGRNQVQVFEAPLLAEGAKTKPRLRAKLAADLAYAMDREQLRLCFDPVFDSAGSLGGFELLLCWQHPELGNLRPALFLGAAEQTGTLLPMGAWALKHACRYAQQWQAQRAQPLRLSVNVSLAEWNSPELASTLESALEQSSLPPELLQLELAAEWFLSPTATHAEQLAAIERLRIRLLVDEYGSGQSSFSSLHDLPVSVVKIDPGLVEKLDGSARQRSTVRAIVVLAHHLGIEVAADGVATEQQQRELHSMECDQLQGPLFSELLTPEQAGWLVAREGQPASGVDGNAAP